MNQHHPKEKAETSSSQWKGSAPDAKFELPRVEATPGEHYTKHFSP